ncbi:hypothetical protein DV872_01615 [Oceanispirochaeta sp. M1]|nr:hypothetical protein DV872_01615 [Oceanispirochaeta sp. M1]
MGNLLCCRGNFTKTSFKRVIFSSSQRRTLTIISDVALIQPVIFFIIFLLLQEHNEQNSSAASKNNLETKTHPLCHQTFLQIKKPENDPWN